MKRGIILMNLGSPASTGVNDVRKYLHEFLMDGRVIDMSYLSRLLLVKGIIVPSQMAIANTFSLTVTFLKKFIVKKS